MGSFASLLYLEENWNASGVTVFIFKECDKELQFSYFGVKVPWFLHLFYEMVSLLEKCLYNKIRWNDTIAKWDLDE